eukprot:c8569_g1_i2.p1 GENE.c8569_g1_i2~~c8569_g1_i2.p1  ORF type:complete len:178 (+),score=20.16 c8569_g1_i2:136-669(+)
MRNRWTESSAYQAVVDAFLANSQSFDQKQRQVLMSLRKLWHISPHQHSSIMKKVRCNTTQSNEVIVVPDSDLSPSPSISSSTNRKSNSQMFVPQTPDVPWWSTASTLHSHILPHHSKSCLITSQQTSHRITSIASLTLIFHISLIYFLTAQVHTKATARNPNHTVCGRSLILCEEWR